MNRLTFAWLSWAVVFLAGAPAIANAQQAAPAGAAAAPPVTTLWVVAGGASTTLLGDCTDCAADTYLHTGSVMGIVGRSINRRTDIGAEVAWAPTTLASGDSIRITFLMASAQYRPWQTKGFFLRAGSGMAFVRNWLGTVEENAPSIRSKAFALAVGAGWEWRASSRLGFQVFAAQHAAALGDLEGKDTTVENVMGNFWSVGAAIVIR
jgi:hypothetical protein